MILRTPTGSSKQTGIAGIRFAAPVLLVFMFCLTMIGCTTGPKGPGADLENSRPLTEEQRRLNIESFEYIWQTINDKYWDPEMGGLDWQSIHDELYPSIEKAKTMEEARQPMFELVSKLGKSHFQIFPADLYEDINPDGTVDKGDGATGMHIRVVDKQALVVSVEPSSPAGQLGIRPGWEILRIGGIEIRPKLEELFEKFGDKTFDDYIYSGAIDSRLHRQIGDTVSVQFLDGRNNKKDLEIVLAEAKGKRAQFGNLPATHVWVETKRLDENIGYIAFNFFLDPMLVMMSVNTAMDEFQDCRGIIIDLRGNPGGIGSMAMGIAGWFIDEKGYRLGTMTTREGEIKFVVSPRAHTFNGPLAVLIDGLSASTSEILAGGLRDLERAQLFGEQTAGAALPSMIEKLPNGDGFQYAIADYVSKSGDTLEGAGVLPHVEVVPTREKLLQGGDPILDSAVDWMLETH
ncbi:MAG: hypothetical protein KJ970_07740 [Candidatus Eisenbacteria bacterium]|uniref:Tail specific protease domain-containing protein n=1 Tax=Eiseniibacteriota bacterium TaxID=2212470 RepID=A0A948RXE2_UNCEI|nr:hypothetical protein [Candidatus Eisenbacteria bacterium]MBU1947083.1 hypothetical protein [Candidatus Eisenbacteria bacterium]MBU2690807.1 hypothetical protein [Candidatus Eisenbacteria bacterium]